MSNYRTLWILSVLPAVFPRTFAVGTVTLAIVLGLVLTRCS